MPVKQQSGHAVLLVLILGNGAWAQPPTYFTPDQDTPNLTAASFRAAFELAFDRDEDTAIERLVSAHPGQVDGLLDAYLRTYVEKVDESDRELALARARMLAEAIEATGSAPALMAMIEHIESWTARDREDARIARREYERGIGLTAAGKPQEAILVLSAALVVVERLGYSTLACRATGHLGLSYAFADRPEDAVTAQKRAVRLAEDVGDQRGLAIALNGLGIAHDYLAEYADSIECYKRLLNLVQLLNAEVDEAHALNNLGLAYRMLGNYDQALEHNRRALIIRERIGNQRDIGDSLLNIAHCYQRLGQLDRSRENYQQALAVYELCHNQHGTVLALNGIGLILRDQGHVDAAITYHERSLAVAKEPSSQQDRGTILVNLGICHGLLGQYAKALSYQEEALAIAETSGNQDCAAAALTNLGHCLGSLEKYEQAIDHNERSLALSEQSGDQLGATVSLDYLGQWSQALARHGDALSYFLRCARILALIPRRLSSDAGRVMFLDRWQPLAERIAISAAQVGSDSGTAQAFEALDALTGRVLLEGLQEHCDKLQEQRSPELVSQHRALLREMQKLRLNLARASSTRGGDEPSDDLRKALVQAEAKLASLEEDLRFANPALAELVAPAPASLVEVRDQILAEDEALLKYVLGEERVYVCVVTRERVQFLALGETKEVRALASQLIELLAAPGRLDSAFREPARMLFRILLQPAWEALRTKPNLTIIPDGLLAFVPFEVLLTDEPRSESSAPVLPYVVLEKAVRYVPSASVLKFLSAHARAEHHWTKDALLMGDPTFDVGAVLPTTLAARGIEVISAERGLSLPHTRDEVIDIASSLVARTEPDVMFALRDMGPSGTVRAARFDLFVGNMACKTNLETQLSDYRIVHLATHGYFDTKYPWFSGLILAATPADSSAGFLTLSDIAQLNLDADVVFLSACETARGSLVRGEGIMSTARSFALAGARSVVATQWQVADDAAAVLARAFYPHLLAGLSPAAALRRAKLALMDEGSQTRGARPIDVAGNERGTRWSHPSTWGPFVIFGR